MRRFIVIIFLMFWKDSLDFVAFWQKEKVKNIVFRKRGVFSPYISYRYFYFTDTDIFTCKHINLSPRPVNRASLQFPMFLMLCSGSPPSFRSVEEAPLSVFRTASCLGSPGWARMRPKLSDADAIALSSPPLVTSLARRL